MLSLANVEQLIAEGSIEVYDDGGQFADRYWVHLDPEAWPVEEWCVWGFTMSEYPNHPQGVNMTIDFAVSPDADETPLEIEQIPAKVRWAIRYRLNEFLAADEAESERVAREL